MMKRLEWLIMKTPESIAIVLKTLNKIEPFFWDNIWFL